MFDANDYNLEELSRKAAEDFYDETLIPSWQQLEKKLDIELPVKKKRRQVFAFWIFFAALLGSFLYTGYERSFNKKNCLNTIAETIMQSQKNIEQEKALPIPNKKIVYKDSLNIRSNQSTQFTINNKRLGSNKIAYTISNNISAKSDLKLDETADADNSSISPKQHIKLQKDDTKELSPEKNKMGDLVSFSSENVENEGLKREENSHLKAAIVPIKSDDKLSSSKISDASLSDKKQISNGDLNIDKQTTRGERIKHSFSIAAVAGGNINSVNFNKSSGVGFDYGFLLGYKLSSKFEIKTGVILSRKYFSTTGKSMSFDSAKLNLPSYTSIKLQDATGYCRFVEIPVMLYYSFPAKSNTSFYAGAGFSINKMRMEKIHYTFLVNLNTLVERTHAGAYHNADAYSTSLTSNIYFGLKQKLSRQWSLSFEPYLKIPLTKVNDSDLKLTTYGAWSSLILTLPNKRNK